MVLSNIIVAPRASYQATHLEEKQNLRIVTLLAALAAKLFDEIIAASSLDEGILRRYREHGIKRRLTRYPGAIPRRYGRRARAREEQGYPLSQAPVAALARKTGRETK